MSKRLVSQKELENGMWQFVLDHAKVYNKDLYQVKFVVSTKQDLMRRIFARASLIYVVKDEEKLEKELQKQITKIHLEKQRQKSAQEREDRIGQLPRFKRWVIIKLRRITNKLIHKWLDSR